MPRKEKFIDGETVSFDDEPTEVLRRDEPEEDAPTVAHEVPPELLSSTLPVREDDPDDPHLRDTVMDPPPMHAEAYGEVDTEPPNEDDESEARDVDLSVRLADDLDADSVETVTEVIAEPADDLVIVFQDESSGREDSLDEEFDARETAQRPGPGPAPGPADKQTVIGKRGKPRSPRVASKDETVGRGKASAFDQHDVDSETRAGHRRARTRRGDSAAGPLPLQPSSDDDAVENRTTQRRTKKKRKREPSVPPSDDEITKVRE